MSAIANRPSRVRWHYAIAAATTIALGLGSRAVALPWWLEKNAGDALYATLMFWFAALVAPRSRAWRLAVVALSWCVAVEVLQLYRAPWIEAVRATTPGRLVLGEGFNAFDLVCYAIGVGVAVALDRAARELRSTPPA